jgi:hypothetical protein
MDVKQRIRPEPPGAEEWLGVRVFCEKIGRAGVVERMANGKVIAAFVRFDGDGNNSRLFYVHELRKIPERPRRGD